MAQDVMALENLGGSDIRPVHARALGEDNTQYVFSNASLHFLTILLVRVVVLFATCNVALLAAIIIYFPAHLVHVHERTTYYLCGNNSAILPDCSTRLLYE